MRDKNFTLSFRVSTLTLSCKFYWHRSSSFDAVFDEGIRDVVCDGRNGYRIQPYDAHQFARVIGDILDSKLEYLSESAYQFAIENFAWETLGDRYIECLQKIAAKSMMQHDL